MQPKPCDVQHKSSVQHQWGDAQHQPGDVQPRQCDAQQRPSDVQSGPCDVQPMPCEVQTQQCVQQPLPCALQPQPGVETGTPSRKRKPKDIQEFEETPSKFPRTEPTLTRIANPKPRKSKPQSSKEPGKIWHELTNIDGKLIMMKTLELGLQKTTRKPKPTITPQVQTPARNQNPRKREKVQISQEELLTPRRLHLKNFHLK